ncbi:Uncharacterised protein [Streptococcus pneumoniae]|nr:Uncharacterised protein [Streptococcus pneumoniae]
MVSIDTRLNVNDFTNDILVRKSSQTLAVKVVVVIILRNKTITNKLVDKSISFFGASIE